MRKKLALLVLACGVGFAHADLEKSVSNEGTITSELSGRIDVPIGMAKEYIQDIALIAKIAKSINGFGYEVGVNSSGKVYFSNPKGYTSIVEKVSYFPTPEGFRKELTIRGNRSLSDFESQVSLSCREEKGGTEYNSKVNTSLKNRFLRWATKGAGKIPLVDRKIQQVLREEQESVAKMINYLVGEIRSDPQGFINKLKSSSSTNFSKEEIIFIEESLRANGFLEETKPIYPYQSISY